MTYLRVESQRDECGGEEAATMCKQKLEDVEDLELEHLGRVEMECFQYHCEATSMVLDKCGQQPWKIRAVLHSGAGG